MNDDILDTNHLISNENTTVEWWERKRMIYNIVVIGVLILATITQMIWDKQTFNLNLLDLILAIIWIVGANIFYCLGLGIDLAVRYYRGKESKIIRNTLFFLGLLFSAVWTFISTVLNSLNSTF